MDLTTHGGETRPRPRRPAGTVPLTWVVDIRKVMEGMGESRKAVQSARLRRNS